MAATCTEVIALDQEITAMKTLTIVTTLAMALGTAQALAQAPTTTTTTAPSSMGPAPARPGHVPGVGESLPLSNKASNIDGADTHSTTAPTLPASGLGPNDSPQAYLREARADLVKTGQTGQAQQAMEMAETRALDRSVVASQVDHPDDSTMVQRIRDARMALGRSDIPAAIKLIDLALTP